MNTARTDIEREGKNTTVRTEELDPLLGLCTPDGRPQATVSISVGTQVNFGEVKVTAHVSYQCDQNTEKVDQAGMLAFEKAVSFMNDGLQLLTAKPEGPG